MDMTALKPASYNPRSISDAALAGLQKSLHLFGDISGFTWNIRTGHLVAGHQRLRALQEQYGDALVLEVTDVDGQQQPAAITLPTGEYFPIRVVDWDKPTERAANIAANATTIQGEFTPDLVPILDELRDTFPAFDDLMFDSLTFPEPPPLDPPPPDPGPQLDKAAELQEKWQTARGQVWTIPSATGPLSHRLMCGDCTVEADVAALMQGAKVNGCFTSPPYAEQRKEQYGGTPADKYVEWWAAVQENIAAVLLPDGSFFVNIKPHSEELDRVLYVMDLVIAHVRQWGWHFAEEFCWERNGVPSEVVRRFKNQFEPVFQFAKGPWKIRPEAVMYESDDVPIPLGPGVGSTDWAKEQGMGKVLTRNRSAPGMAYPGNRIRVASVNEALNHPAAYPVGLPSFFMKAFSDPGDSWFDPFLGSGTTLVACENLGRVAYGMEISEKYTAVCLERMKGLGLTPRLCEGDANA